jgi:uncharacterized protein (DUF736 family)
MALPVATKRLLIWFKSGFKGTLRPLNLAVRLSLTVSSREDAPDCPTWLLLDLQVAALTFATKQ